ncbi:MAG: hypothetical protein ACYSO1_07520 [Planctomycetota bacterium]|jgi:prepilin-type processing-associated H-X9-DG protein
MEEKKKVKKKFSLFNVLLVIIIFFAILYFLIPCNCHKHAFRVLCAVNVDQLYIGLSCYKVDTGQYPPSEKWCDSIKEFLDKDADFFLCRADNTGPCSYAMNENIPADANDLPGNLVLLFESAPGWNQTGGPNDVVTDRHGENNPGANIAFADGTVKFVKTEDIPNLRWTVEKQQAVSAED